MSEQETNTYENTVIAEDELNISTTDENTPEDKVETIQETPEKIRERRFRKKGEVAIKSLLWAGSGAATYFALKSGRFDSLPMIADLKNDPQALETTILLFSISVGGFLGSNLYDGVKYLSKKMGQNDAPVSASSDRELTSTPTQRLEHHL